MRIWPYCGKNKNIYSAGFECSFVKPENYAFYKKMIDLWRYGYSEVIQKLLKHAGYEVPLEKMCEEAERRIEDDAEKWKRIKKAWGLNY